MRRPISLLVFPILAATAGLSLLARLVAGLVLPADVPGLYEVLALVAPVWAHGSAQQYLESSESRIKAKAEAEGMPDWVGAQAEKNFWKATPYVWSGYLLIGLMIWSSTRVFQSQRGGAWFNGLLAFSLAFQVGAFVGEYVIMAAQTRLLRDVEGWARSG